MERSKNKHTMSRIRQRKTCEDEVNVPLQEHKPWDRGLNYFVLTTSSPGASVFDFSRIPPLSPVSSICIFSLVVIQKKPSKRPTEKQSLCVSF